jgi:hypothetical protein
MRGDIKAGRLDGCLGRREAQGYRQLSVYDFGEPWLMGAELETGEPDS